MRRTYFLTQVLQVTTIRTRDPPIDTVVFVFSKSTAFPKIIVVAQFVRWLLSLSRWNLHGTSQFIALMSRLTRRCPQFFKGISAPSQEVVDLLCNEMVTDECLHSLLVMRTYDWREKRKVSVRDATKSSSTYHYWPYTIDRRCAKQERMRTGSMLFEQLTPHWAMMGSLNTRWQRGHFKMFVECWSA